MPPPELPFIPAFRGTAQWGFIRSCQKHHNQFCLLLFLFFCSVFTPGLMENDVKHQEWFMEVRQLLAPWAMDKVNCKLFSHSKLLYPALEEAAKTARGEMWEKERLCGYLWAELCLRRITFLKPNFCAGWIFPNFCAGMDFSWELPWMWGFPAPHLPHETAGTATGAGWKSLH